MLDYKTYSKLKPFSIILMDGRSPKHFKWAFDATFPNREYSSQWKELGLNWESHYYASPYPKKMGWELSKVTYGSNLYDVDTGKLIWDGSGTIDDYIKILDYLILEKGLKIHLIETVMTDELYDLKSHGECINGFYDGIYTSYSKSLAEMVKGENWSNIHRKRHHYTGVPITHQLNDFLDDLLGKRLVEKAKLLSEQRDIDYRYYRHNCTNYDYALSKGENRNDLFLKYANDFLKILMVIREYQPSIESAFKLCPRSYEGQKYLRIANSDLDSIINGTIAEARRVQRELFELILA